MTKRSHFPARVTLVLCSAALLSAGCASHAVRSGAAVGAVGRGLSIHARAVPQGAQACALSDALASSTPGTPDKPLSDTCAKTLNADLLWRRAMLVLAAYSTKLEALANGGNPASSGQVEGLLTGVRGEDWIDAEPGPEQDARAAVAKLASQMTSPDEKADFDKTVKDAAPQVKTICSGLTAYLEEQAKKFADVRDEIAKKRAAKSDRRCATLDSRTICVSESVIDRIVYADAYGGLSIQEQNHLDARDDVASFCAAHAKLETAAGSGDTNKDETYAGVIDAVKGVSRAQPRRGAPAAGSSSAAPGKAPEKK